MDDFDWGDDEGWKISYDRKRQDALHQTAKFFAEHLKRLIANSDDPSSKSIQVSKAGLYKDFVYPKVAKEAWLRLDKKNYSEYEQGHQCAYSEGLIEIDEEVRPYRYTLIAQDTSQFSLRPYQSNIIEDTTAAEGSVLIEAPTGSGKSVMANEIAKNEIDKGGKVLIVAPKIILLEQLQDAFQELDPQIIHGAKDYNKEHSVFISTIQTAHNRDLGFEPTMILIDEVHFGFSGKMIKALLKDFKGQLVGLSATPYDERGELLQGFDLHIDKYNLRYMLENNYLIHPKCYAPLKVDLSNVSMVGGDYNQADLDSEFNNFDSILHIVESTKERIRERGASLVFCINISHSEAMAKAYSDAGIPTKAIHSKLSKKEQNAILKEYKDGTLKMLANPMMLTTGFDHPITDTIVLARATKSQNLYRQMVGRALRLSPGKEDAVILDCSNVITNLGLPTDDIKKRDSSFVKNVRICSECKSEKLYKKVKNNRAYMLCADCGHTELAMENGFECEACGLVHTDNATFKTINRNLYLTCDECQHDTLISESSSKEDMSLIFDATYTDGLKKKVTLEFFSYVLEKKGFEFVLNAEVSKHIKAIQALIVKEPSIFVNVEAHHFSWDLIVQSGDEYIWERAFGKEWRIFDQNWEEELLNEGLKDLNQNLKNSRSVRNSFDLIQSIHKVTKTPALTNGFIEEVLLDIKRCKIKNMDSICNKRLKDLYFNNGDLMQMQGFVQIMESVL